MTGGRRIWLVLVAISIALAIVPVARAAVRHYDASDDLATPFDDDTDNDTFTPVVAVAVDEPSERVVHVQKAALGAQVAEDRHEVIAIAPKTSPPPRSET